MPAIVLLSGGVESTTLLHQLYPQEPLRALFVDYGQRAAARERAAAERHCAVGGVQLSVFDLAAVGAAFRAEQTHKLHVPLPHRNLVIVSLALSFAAQLGATRIYLALNREDTHAYASAGLAFIERLRAVAQTLAPPAPVELLTPLIALGKADIVRAGRALGIDYALTYSCLLGYARHCGSCPQCRKRRAAFADAGVAEPAGFYRDQ